MKLKIFDRITLVILILALIALSAGAIYVAWFGTALGLGAIVDNLFNGPVINKIIVSVIAILILFFCVRILFVRKRSPREDKRPSSPGILIRNGEAGTSFLSIDALESMIQKFVRSNTKVRDSQCKVHPGEDNVSLSLRIVPSPEVIIPEFTSELQSSLKNHIEGMTGIKVREIQVIVASDDNVPSGTSLKPRVE